jgi:hypothetical protein
MKEFTSQKGGRHTYVDDIINLQDIALVLNSLFTGCEDFVLSGCNVSGNKISPGFVYMNGKVRYCSGMSNVSSWPVYIVESNSTEQVSYADSSDKVGRNIYGCVISSSVPTVNDPLTNKAPQSIMFKKDGEGVPRLKDAFFGKYALMIDSPFASQTVNKKVVFNGEITAKCGAVVNDNISMVRGAANCSIYYEEDGTLVVSSKMSGSDDHKLTINTAGDLQFYHNDTCIFTFSKDKATVAIPIHSDTLNGGGITITGSDVYNSDAQVDTGSININVKGFNGETKYFRNTNIGDGQGNIVIGVNGKNKTVAVNGSLTICDDSVTGIKIKHSTLAKSDNSLVKYIAWVDKDNAVMANFGFANNKTTSFYIDNKIGDVVINNTLYVNGSLYVNGNDIDKRYVKVSDYDTAINKKANTNDVYTKDDANSTFLGKNTSLSVFVDNAGGKDAACDIIGAATSSNFERAVVKSQKFQDIVGDGLDTSSASYVSDLEKRQRELCENIGAAYKDDVSAKPKDTGWVRVDVSNCGISEKLYARQIGNIVSIQGRIHTHHDGTIFTLPSSIDPPVGEIGYSYNRGGEWCCKMASGSRECVVDYCSGGCSQYIGFLLTYMV